MAALWPDTDELKRVVNVPEDDHDDTLSRVMAAAIHRVKGDVGDWDEAVDEPNDSLAAAALRMAELMADRPLGTNEQGWPNALSADPTYQTYLKGHRRRFGIA